jgi:hypothetical protein
MAGNVATPHPGCFWRVVIPDHIGRLQVLVIDGIVLSHQRQRGLVVEVNALPLQLLMRLRQQRDRLAASAASLLAA